MLCHNHIDLRVPATIAGALLAASMLALGHHLLYEHLAGAEASSNNYTIVGFHFSTQEANIAAGTALAYLVKVNLSIALCTAYIQLFWKAVSGRQTRLSRIDSLFSALDNAWTLLRVQLWGRYPLLFVVAILAWLVPVASIISPATLSVRSAQVVPPISKLFNVSNIDFSNLKFAASMPANWTNPSEYNYIGPQFELERQVAAVAAQGEILFIDPPSSNSSWELEFHGPSVQCTPVDDDFHKRVADNIGRAEHAKNCTVKHGYLAWTPDTDSALPFAMVDQQPVLRGSGLGPIKNSGHDAASFYIGWMSYNETPVASSPPAAAQNTSSQSEHRTTSDNRAKRNPIFIGHGMQVVPILGYGCEANYTAVQVLECRLHNVSYHTAFTYVNGRQNVTVSTEELSPVQDVSPFSSLQAPNGNFWGNIPADCISPDSIANGTRCAYNPVAVQTIAYQSIMDAFGRALVGSVALGGNETAPTTLIANTSLMSTVLLQASELDFLRNWFEGNTSHVGAGQLQSVVASSYGLSGLWRNQTVVTTSMPLKEMIEQLFHNITVSLMASPYLRADYASPFAPPAVNVTFDTYHNIYVYSAQKLWLAYGIAIGFTALGSGLGLLAILLNGASFSNDFSTILRTTRNADISAPLEEKDTYGRAPLPKYLAEATIELLPKSTAVKNSAPVSVSKPHPIVRTSASRSSSASALS